MALTSLMRAAQTSRPVAAQLRGGAPGLSGAPQGVVQRETISGTLVVLEGGYACFNRGGKKYHINEMDPKHVTCDSDGRTHFYFTGTGTGIKDAVGKGKKKKGGETKKFKFSELPSDIQTFIKNNYDAIVGVKAEGTIDL